MAVEVSELPDVPGSASVRADGAPRGRGSRAAAPPPCYERRRLKFPAPSRPKFWRRNAIMAANEAVRVGEMPPLARTHFIRWLDYSNDHGKDVIPTLRTVGEDEQRSERTAAHWSRWLREQGWLEVQHRAKQDHLGQWTGRSNITRPMIPGRWQEWLRDTGHLGGKGGPTPKAPRRPGGGPASPPPPVPDVLPVPLPAAAEAPTAPRSLREVMELVDRPARTPRRRRGPP